MEVALFLQIDDVIRVLAFCSHVADRLSWQNNLRAAFALPCEWIIDEPLLWQPQPNRFLRVEGRRRSMSKNVDSSFGSFVLVGNLNFQKHSPLKELDLLYISISVSILYLANIINMHMYRIYSNERGVSNEGLVEIHLLKRTLGLQRAPCSPFA